MLYVALLRGINVGGKNKIDMKQLKITFEEVGLQHVKTYINSGNIIFDATDHSREELVEKLESAITKDFGLPIKVLLRTFNEIKQIYQALPSTWVNDETMKSDVMFLWENMDSPSVVNKLPIKENIDEVKYVAGAILWRVDRKLITRSGMMKLAGTPLYKEMTIRNCNTVRKLYELMAAQTKFTQAE